MEIDQYRAAVLATLFELTDIGESVEVLRFTFSGDFAGEFVVAGAPLGGNGECLAFNLPTYSTTVFIGLAEGGLKRVALILANLEDHERQHGLKLSLGEAVVLPNPGDIADMPYAVWLMATATLTDTKNVPDCQNVGGRHTSFLLAVPLTKAEFDFRREHGPDRLLVRFESQGKSIAF